MGLITDLTAVANDILGVRDTIGAAIHLVYFTTRTWSGTEPGLGTITDVDVVMSPSPALINLEHKYKTAPVGRYMQGDILLQHVSKQSYPSEDTVRLKSTLANVQKFYKIDGQLYQAISVVEKYITWDVHIRRVNS